MELLRQEIWPAGTQVILEVLVGNQPAQAFSRAVGFTDYALTMRWQATDRPRRQQPFATRQAAE